MMILWKKNIVYIVEDCQEKGKFVKVAVRQTFGQYSFQYNLLNTLNIIHQMRLSQNKNHLLGFRMKSLQKNVK